MTKAEFISKVQSSLETELKKKTVTEVIDAVFESLKGAWKEQPIAKIDIMEGFYRNEGFITTDMLVREPVMYVEGTISSEKAKQLLEEAHEKGKIIDCSRRYNGLVSEYLFSLQFGNDPEYEKNTFVNLMFTVPEEPKTFGDKIKRWLQRNKEMPDYMPISIGMFAYDTNTLEDIAKANGWTHKTQNRGKFEAVGMLI